MAERCPSTIKFGTMLTTRCFLDAGHVDDIHEGRGLPEFPYQRVHWIAGDRREFASDRADQFAWESMPCPIKSSVTGVDCLLPAGHPQDGIFRFHRYPKASGGLE